MMPSSHSRAVAYHGLPWCSYCARIGALKASSSSADQSPPRASMPSRFTVASTPAACSPPITLIPALDHLHTNRAPSARPHLASFPAPTLSSKTTVHLGKNDNATTVTVFAPCLPVPASSYCRPTIEPGMLCEHTRGMP